MTDEELVDRRLQNNPFCPYCGGYSTSRPGPGTYLKDKTYKRTRRYTCKDNSGHTFRTTETISKSSIMVRKRNGSDEVFDRRKVLVGIKRANCDNGDVENNRNEFYRSLTDQVTNLLSSSVNSIKNSANTEADVSFYHSTDIGEVVLKTLLNNANAGAAMRFASSFYSKEDLKEGASTKEMLTFIGEKLEALESKS